MIRGTGSSHTFHALSLLHNEQIKNAIFRYFNKNTSTVIMGTRIDSKLATTSSFVSLVLVVHHHDDCDQWSVLQSLEYFSYFDWTTTMMMMTLDLVVAMLVF